MLAEIEKPTGKPPEDPALSPEDMVMLERLRPKTRGDCKGGIRPCPFVSCRFNLYLDTRKREPTPHYPDLTPDEIPHDSCALDVAEEGEIVSLERIGTALRLTRERVRQIEYRAVEKIRPLLNPE